MATLAVTNTFAAGTTIVAADMNTNFSDIETFVNSSPGLVQDSLVNAKGELLVASAADTITRLGAGTNTYVLTADSTEGTHFEQHCLQLRKDHGNIFKAASQRDRCQWQKRQGCCYGDGGNADSYGDSGHFGSG